MAPQEVAGLQQLAMAHGGSLTINPQTGLYEASFLKKILPQIIGAVLPSVPGLGAITKTLGFGNQALGSALIVGGATGLIEGDLKKGLMAGLGAYSGASIAGGLKAAADVGTSSEVTTQAAGPSLKDTAFKFSTDSFGQDVPLSTLREMPTSSVTGKAMTRFGSPFPETVTKAPALPTAPTSFLGQMGQGVKNVLTTKEGASKFMEGLGGGYTSPIGSALSRYAAFSGAMLPFTQEQKQFPVGSAGGDEIVYIPGQYDPSNTSVFQAQGQYYRRTPKGLVPYNPWAMAPGARGFADGGAVSEDPTVLATRSYIEELNRRALNPFTGEPTSGIGGGGGLNAFGPQYLPPATTGGGVDAGGGDVGGASAGDIVGGLATSYLINKGLEKGGEYLSDLVKGKDATEQKTEQKTEPTQTDQPAQTTSTTPATSAIPFVTGALGALNPFADTSAIASVGEPIYDAAGNISGFRYPDGTIEPVSSTTPAATTPDATAPAATTTAPATTPTTTAKLDADLEKLTQVGGDLSKLSSYMPVKAGLESLGTLGGLSSTGFGAVAPTTLAEAAKATSLSAGMTPSGSIASQYGGMKGALEAGSTTEAGLGTLKNTIIPGVATALGAYNTAKAIEAGKEGRAAFSAASTAASAAKLGAPLGPAGMLAAAAIAAIGASMVNTKEQGDIALRNYWKAVDGGRGLGSAPPEELANGFINFYRTNKNNFAGQEKYGRKGNEDFVYDMTQIVNKAVKDGTVSKDADAHEIYQKAVQPWLNSMGSGPQDEDAKRIQDYMMTDMIYNFMQGKPISNAQVKGDKNYKIVSEKPVFAGGTSPVVGQMQQAREQALTQGIDGRALAEFLGNRAEGIPTAVNPFAEAPVQVKRGIPVDEIVDMGSPLEERESRFAFGGAVGDDFNFGFAGGGMPEYKAGGKLLDGPGDGMSDDIPAVIRGKGVQRAALADGEFVVPADVVSHLGNGSTKAGAKKLYDMMARIRKARTGETRQAPAVKANRYLPA